MQLHEITKRMFVIFPCLALGRNQANVSAVMAETATLSQASIETDFQREAGERPLVQGQQGERYQQLLVVVREKFDGVLASADVIGFGPDGPPSTVVVNIQGEYVEKARNVLPADVLVRPLDDFGYHFLNAQRKGVVHEWLNGLESVK